MLRTFTILTDKVDSENDRFILAGVRIQDYNKILVTDRFDVTKPIGYASVEVSDREIKATMEVPVEFENCFGAIGFSDPEVAINDGPDFGIRVIERCTLQQIGLCPNTNADSTIKRINEY